MRSGPETVPREASSNKAAAVAQRRQTVLKSIKLVRIRAQTSSQAIILLYLRLWSTSVLLTFSFTVDLVSSVVLTALLEYIQTPSTKCVRCKLGDQEISGMKLIQTAFCSQEEARVYQFVL